jgi:hypothetical protein
MRIRVRKNLVFRAFAGATIFLIVVFIWMPLNLRLKPLFAPNQQDSIPSRWVSIAFSHKRNNGVWAVAYADTFQAANLEAERVCEATGGIKCGALMMCSVLPPEDPRRLRFAAFAKDSFVGNGGNKNLTCGFASIKDAEAKAMQGACDPAVSRLEWGPCRIAWSSSIYP